MGAIAHRIAPWALIALCLGACQTASQNGQLSREQAGSRYVGNQVCRTCHSRAYELWLGTKHARTYVMMQTANGMAIAAEMGVKIEDVTRDSPCLGCHATAADAPTARRLPDFHFEDGVQCERCHGPGEAHVLDEEDGGGRAAALTYTPSRDDCLQCHRQKPSHALLNRPAFNVERALQRIAHGGND